MTILRKHIAYFLFVIFLFSITFQPIHIVWHHSHGYEGEQHLFNKGLTDKDAHRNQTNIAKDAKLCPIGEYVFSINDLPDILVFSSLIPQISCVYMEKATQKQYKQIFSEKSSRAPPLLLF